MSGLRACPRCRALYETSLPDCPECGQSIRPRLAREQGGWFDRLGARGLTAVRILVAINVVLYGLALLKTGQFRSGTQGIAGFGSIPARVILSLGGLTWDSVVERHEWWRLVCPVFLHFSLIHILFNCMVISSAGRLAEAAYGPAKFAAFFLLCGVSGTVTSLLWHGDGYWIGAGASGAGFGILGMAAAFGLKTRNEDLKSYMVRWAVMCLVLGYVARADNAAHVGGLVAGALLGFLSPGAARTRLNWRSVVLWDVAALMSFGLVIVSFAAVLAAGGAK